MNWAFSVPEKILLCTSEHVLGTFCAPYYCTYFHNPFSGIKCPSKVHFIPYHFLREYPNISTELQKPESGNIASGICNGRNKWGQVNPGTA